MEALRHSQEALGDSLNHMQEIAETMRSDIAGSGARWMRFTKAAPFSAAIPAGFSGLIPARSTSNVFQ
ncbi:MAG: hypothetical protein AB7O56_13360 [Bauldia sp.]